jgi:hypothetical protein
VISALPRVSAIEAKKGRFFDNRPEKVMAVLRSRERQFAAVGPAGTGKTRTDLEKIRACCIKYPGCRWVIARSVRKWLTQSALVTWEEKVIEPGLLLPDKVARSQRQEYRFRNGSIVAVAGLDDPDSVMSTEWDGILIVEATEIDKDMCEQVGTRLRNGMMPYQQLILEANPGPPHHWMKAEIDAGRLPCVESRHRDNPHYFDAEKNDWTPAGVEYMARLDLLTGSRRLRLKDGKWAQSEGVVYEEWDSTVHVIAPFSIPADWKRYIIVDFGYNDPMVVQWWAVDHDDRGYMYREIFTTGRLVEDVAAWAKRLHLMNGDPPPLDVVCDHDREDRATFEKHSGWRTVPANKTIELGIQDVKARLKVQGDGKPRLFVFNNALCHEPDSKLSDTRKPTSTVQEFDGYVWDPRAKKGERPLDKDNHGMDCCRYFSRHLEQVQDGTAFDGYGTPSAYNDEYSLPDDTFR